MSSTMNINNMDNDMSSNISNLNNIPNLAKSIEQGLDNTSGQQMQQPDMNNYNPTQPNFQKMQEYQQMHQMMGLQQQQQQPMNMQNMMGLQQQQHQQQHLPTQASYNDMNNYGLMQQNYNKPVDAKKPSVLNYVSENFREPILIAVVFVILNHPALLNALSKYVPHIGVGDVEYSMFNLVLRGLVMGIVIVLLNKTLLK